MKLSQFIAEAEKLWPISGAEDWDLPGLAVGDPTAEIKGVLLAVDVTSEVIDLALDSGANLLVTHHPLLLRGVSTLAESTGKGRLVARAIKAGLAIYSAHTNADVVVDGVSDTMGKALGLIDVQALVPTSNPQVGHGRIGRLVAPMRADELVAKLLDVLPATASGIRASVSPDTLIQTVALCGGAGDAFVQDAHRAGADVYITSDLRHHVADESPIGLIDVSHWAAESLWLDVAANQLRAATGLNVSVSHLVTDPWIFTERRS